MTGSNGARPLVSVTIDGRTVRVPAGTLVVEAAKQAGVHIPVFCYHPRLEPAGVCRMCLVKVDKAPKLVAACTTPVTDGMVVDTRHPEVREMQQAVLEFLLINHPLDCPVCDKGGECELQDLTFKYGPGTSRLADGKVRRRKAVELGPFVVLDEERCILCRRCVRFDDEVAGEAQLVLAERAIRTVVTTASGRVYDHYFTGNVIELCPVGALTARPYRFRARPWDLSPVASRCTQCSVHCPVRLDFRHGRLMRVVSPGVPDDGPFGAPGPMAAYHTPADEVPGFRGMGWLCDRGRFNHGYLHSAARLREPLAGRDVPKRPLGWDEALDRVAGAIREAVRRHGPGAVAVVGGGRLTLEEAARLRELVDRVGTPHRDHRVSDQALASLASPGGRTGTADALERAAGVVAVGQPPVEAAPVLDLAIRRAARDGAAVWATGPVRPPYRGRVRFEPGVGAATAGVLRSWLGELERAAASTPGAPWCIVWDGRGAWDGSAAAVGEAVLDVAGALERAGAQVHVLIPGDQPQSRAAEAAGLLPGPGGLDTAGILREAAQGRVRVLYLVGANLVETFPDRALVEAALETVPFVVVQDLFLTETARRADVVLPALVPAMRGGTLVDLDGTTHRVEAALPPDGAGRADGEILAGLLERLGAGPAAVPGAAAAGERLPALGADEARRVWAAAARGAAHGGAPGRGGPAGQALRVVPLVRLYGGGGTTAFDPAFAARREPAAVWLHPDDAARLGLGQGRPVELRTAHGTLRAPVRIDERIAPGCAGVPAQAAGGGAWRLTAWHDPYPEVVGLHAVAPEVVHPRS